MSTNKPTKSFIVIGIDFGTTKIWSHAMDNIESKLGKELVQNSEFQVVVTLPAIWPPYARYRMEQAVEVSGIRSPRPCGKTTVCFISEPQAAALANMHDFRDTSTVKAGDTMVICDAGGGTVDLVNGMVESTDPFVVEEWVEGEGELCGGVFLDEEFLELIKGKVTPGSWPSLQRSDIRQESEAMKGHWPYKIEALIGHQINAVQKKCRRTTIYIVLVGGFGRSPYLFSRLKTTFNATVLRSKGDKPWTAICRGAVIYGINGHGPEASLGPEIDTRVALRSYGVLSDTLFRPDEHIGCEKYWSEDDQVWNGSYASCTESPPPKVWDSSMEPLCAIQWTGDINIELLPTQTTPLGKVLRKVVYVIEMNYEDGWADFTIYSQGMRVGAHHVNVELR
ncbi:hypothetical protein SNK05_000516 [Fusarium graminearum]